jgi:putative membrane protein
MVDDPRTLQANERTLLAWLRTGVSLITFGFFIAKLGVWLHTQPNMPAAPRSALVGEALVLLGAVAMTVGIVRYLRIHHALLTHKPVPVGAGGVLFVAVAATLLGFYLGVHLMLLS